MKVRQNKTVRRSERIKGKNSVIDEEIPKKWRKYPNVKQAKDAGEWEKWKRAKDEEIECMNRHTGVWDVVCRPKDKEIIGSKWVYSIKEKPRYKKARLVAVGCAQRPGYDHSETFAPVARMESVRLLPLVLLLRDIPAPKIGPVYIL